MQDSTDDTIERYRIAFEESQDAIVILTRGAQVVDVNQACIDLFGRQRQEMLGMDAEVLFAGPGGQQWFQHEMGRRGAIRDYEAQLLRKDGKPIDSLVTSVDWRDKGQSLLGYICIVRDVTAQNKTERSLNLLRRMSDKLNAAVDLDSLLDSLVEQILDLMNAESGCAGLRTPGGMSCDHFFQGSRIIPLVYHCPTGVGWPGWVLAHRTPYLTNDASHDPLVMQEVRDRSGIRSGICVPLADNERDVIGFFEVYNKRDGAEFNEVDVQHSLAAARIASFSIRDRLVRRNLIALAAFGQCLTDAGGFDQMLEDVGRHIAISFNRRSVILLPDNAGLIPRFRSTEFIFDDKERAAASWSWEHGQESGASTEIVSGALAHYLPLKMRGQVIGVLGLEQRTWSSNVQRQVLNAFIGQLALAIERGLLEQKVRRLRFFEESERVQNAVLSAISHDLRTPLAAIATSLDGLLTSEGTLGQAAERELLETADLEVRRLNRLVNNLLSMTRLEAGLSSVKPEPHDLLDIVWAAIEDLGPSGRRGQISIDIPEDLPLVPLDFGLITQVLVNLLSNAFKYSASEQPIKVRGRIIDHQLEILVIDRGIGIRGEDLGRAFDKFYRVAESGSAHGLGLGLAICKEFIEAHGGHISLENNPMGGTIARFILPLEAAAISYTIGVSPP